MTMIASGKPTNNRSFGAITVALLALFPSSVQASPTQSCVDITNAASSSSCVSGAKPAFFSFSMEGTTGVAAADWVPKTETSTSKATGVTSTAARAGEYFVLCPEPGVVVTVGFAAPMYSVAYPSTKASGENVATFPTETLESTPPEFAVLLDTTGVTMGANLVTYVSYTDNQENYRDTSGLMTFLTSTRECDWYATLDTAIDVSRKLHEGHEYECDICSDLSTTQLEALAMYDNGGKKIVCDPTCLDGVSNPINCNYFGLGQICRGCGDCSSCTACPVPDDSPAPSPDTTDPPANVPTPADTLSPTSARAMANTPSPTMTTAMIRTTNEDEDDDSEFDCSACANLSDIQREALAMDDNAVEQVACDPTCLDGVSNPIHCNYFGLGQICRGCGDCYACNPCP